MILWIIINTVSVFTNLYINGEMFGETTFWSALLVSTAFEFFAILALIVVFYAILSLIKKVRKGLKEEKKRYGNKHRRN